VETARPWKEREMSEISIPQRTATSMGVATVQKDCLLVWYMIGCRCRVQIGCRGRGSRRDCSIGCQEAKNRLSMLDCTRYDPCHLWVVKGEKSGQPNPEATNVMQARGTRW